VPDVFVASTRQRFGPGSFGATYLLDPQLFASFVTRRGLVFDTRFVPGRAGRSEDVLLYLVVDGTFAHLGSPLARWVGPTLVVLDEDQFEGAGGAAGLPLRSWGVPFRVVELRVGREVLGPAALAARPFALPVGAEVWERARSALALAEGGGRVDAVLGGLLEALAAEGVVSRDLAGALTAEDARFSRLWAAARPAAEAFDLITSLDAIALGAGLSLRHITREVKDFASALRVPFWGWRESTRRLRIKVAVLGLSAPSLPIAECAKIAGYGSVEAMARAFRDASLEAPSRVRQRLVEGLADSPG
jgi:AraC-like DNA-binding protein